MEDLCKPIEVGRNVVHIHQISVGPSWMDFIVLFLKKDVLPEGIRKGLNIAKGAHVSK